MTRQTKEIINKAVKHYFIEIDHSKDYYKIMKDYKLLTDLVEQGVTNYLILFYLDMLAELKTFECNECKNTNFNYECPIMICSNCNSEFYLQGKTAISMCDNCQSFSLGTCDVGKKIHDTENNNEHKATIVSCKRTAFQGVNGPIDCFVNQNNDSN